MTQQSTPEYTSKKLKTLVQKDACTSVFIAALFTIAKIWKQSECPSTDDWIKKMLDIYIYLTYIYIIIYAITMEYYSTIKENILLFAVA